MITKFASRIHGRCAVVLCALWMTSGVQAQALFPEDSRPAAPDQVQRGREAYGRTCVACHGAQLEGTPFAPALTGEEFVHRWVGRTRAAFSEQLRTTMPPRGLGSLSSEAYADIEAYLVASNANVRARAPGAGMRPRGTPPAAPTPEPQQLAAQAARAAKLAGLPAVSDERLRDPPAADWLAWRRGYEGVGFSPLKQIHRGNVAKLRGAWSWSLPDSSNEITPLVHEGVMFIYSGAVVQALDAATGELLWQYLRRLPASANNGDGARMKSLAIAGDRLFAPTADGFLVALDMRSGRLLWEQPLMPQPDASGRPTSGGLSLSGGVMVVRNTVIVGVSLGVNYRGGCYIVGIDATTGAERWRFHTVARPGTPAGDTWNDTPVQERFGGGVWTPGSHDPALDLVYFGIGNTYSTATLLEPRPGASKTTNNDALYTDATVALRPDTGELVWFYQHQRRDVWDLDWAFEQTVATLPLEGKPRRVIVTAGKSAIFDVMDAATGAWLFSKDMGLQNQVIAIDPVTGEKTTNPAMEPEAGKSRLLCPSSYGARNWPASAMNPGTRTVFLPMVESCADYQYSPRADRANGGRDIHFTVRRPPGSDGNAGRLAALDLVTREIRWTHRQRMPFSSSALATEGGLLFVGDLDRYFYAFDQKDGRQLWRTRLPASPESFPVSYAVDGKQYVAVVAGGGSPMGANSRIHVPELPAAAAGVTLMVFELP